MQKYSFLDSIMRYNASIFKMSDGLFASLHFERVAKIEKAFLDALIIRFQNDPLLGVAVPSLQLESDKLGVELIELSQASSQDISWYTSDKIIDEIKTAATIILNVRMHQEQCYNPYRMPSWYIRMVTSWLRKITKLSVFDNSCRAALVEIWLKQNMLHTISLSMNYASYSNYQLFKKFVDLLYNAIFDGFNDENSVNSILQCYFDNTHRLYDPAYSSYWSYLKYSHEKISLINDDMVHFFQSVLSCDGDQSIFQLFSKKLEFIMFLKTNMPTCKDPITLKLMEQSGLFSNKFIATISPITISNVACVAYENSLEWEEEE